MERVRVQTLEGTWETLGVDRHPGVFPEAITPSWNRHGSDGLAFTIRRDPNAQQIDLQELTPVEYLPDGTERVTWSGFVWEAPAGDDGVTVNARGWQYALDDEPHRRFYASEDLSGWRDHRSYPDALLTVFRQTGTVEAGGGPIVLGYDSGDPLRSNQWLGATIDLGEDFAGGLANVVALDVTVDNPGNAAFNVYLRGHSTPPDVGGGTWQADYWTPFLLPNGSSSPTWVGINPSIFDWRYLTVFLHWPHAAASIAVNSYVRLTVRAARMYRRESYATVDGQRASRLKASTVLADLVDPVAGLFGPIGLSTDASGITATETNLRDLVAVDETLRQMIDRVNGYHAWRWKIDPDRRLLYSPQADRALLGVDLAKPGAEWRDASANSAVGLYNVVKVRGRTGAGVPILTSIDSGNLTFQDEPEVADSVPARRGRRLTYTLDLAAPVDSALAYSMGENFLRLHARSPLRGSVTITDPAAVRLLANGDPVGLGDLGTYTGELILLENLVDPHTGAIGRVGVIASVSRSGDSATIALDNDRGNFGALLNRLGAL